MTSADFPLRGHEPRGGFSDEPSPVFSWTTLWWDFNPLTTPPLGLKSFWCQCLRLTCLRIIESAGCSSCSGLTSQWFRGHYGEVRAWHLYTGQERLDLPEKHPVFELDALFPVSVSLYLFRDTSVSVFAGMLWLLVWRELGFRWMSIPGLNFKEFYYKFFI